MQDKVVTVAADETTLYRTLNLGSVTDFTNMITLTPLVIDFDYTAMSKLTNLCDDPTQLVTVILDLLFPEQHGLASMDKIQALFKPTGQIYTILDKVDSNITKIVLTIIGINISSQPSCITWTIRLHRSDSTVAEKAAETIDEEVAATTVAVAVAVETVSTTTSAALAEITTALA